MPKPARPAQSAVPPRQPPLSGCPDRCRCCVVLSGEFVAFIHRWYEVKQIDGDGRRKARK